MKIIDLLIKIANKEKVPKKIFYVNKTFEYDELEEVYTYHNEDYSINNDLSLYIDGYSFNSLNEEVEIIEEDKEIEEIPFNNGMKEYIDVYHELEHYNYKINELIKAVNELKKGK